MKKLIVPSIVVILLIVAMFAVSIRQLNAATPDVNAEILKALNIQNQQLDRIADSLERISGQQPGWKLPK